MDSIELQSIMSSIAQPPMETPEEQLSETTCSRCEKPLDTTGYPLWCKACQNKYRKELKALKKQMQETRGYAAGVSAFKAYLVGKFALLGHSQFSAVEIAALIQQSKFPNVD